MASLLALLQKLLPSSAEALSVALLHHITQFLNTPHNKDFPLLPKGQPITWKAYTQG